MVISIIDPINPVGHKELNKKLINILSLDNQLRVINSRNFYCKSDLINALLIDVNLYNSNKKYFIYIFLQVINYFKIWFKSLSYKDDVKLHFTYDNVAFFIGRLFFMKSRQILFHHANTDYLSIGYVRFVFKLYMNKVEHIVFAQFIKDRLVEIGVEEGRVNVLQHPLPESIFSNPKIPLKKVFLGIGYALDSKFVDEIIDYESTNGILRKHNIKLILRSPNTPKPNSNSIELIDGHLSVEEYERLIKISTGIICLYPDTYKYRYSGAILDGMRAQKYVFGVNIPIVCHFKDLYPNSCFTFSSIPELFSLMTSEFKHDNDEYEIFMSLHNDESVKINLDQILNLYDGVK